MNESQMPISKSAPIRAISTEQGINYLESNHISINDFIDKQIPSNYGMVYSLPSGEVVLLESGLRDKYTAFIFDSMSVFEKCCEIDYFPVPKENMTWLEAHASEVQNFLIEDDFYLKPLYSILDKMPLFNNINECQSIFDKISIYIRKKSIAFEEKENICYCFSLAVARFCIQKMQIKWQIKKFYEVFNPIYVPFLVHKEHNSNILANIFEPIFRVRDSPTKLPFSLFFYQLSNISIDINLDESTS
ncbi:hypothetical protein GCM10023185_09350 [Hymenobacter saemangeumensis]|uniref:DUF3822 family protein n=1 Tax=Hymenobacter saemangeumensis TaxID=1084522 RepID=A0ABP8I4A4_9BACT